MWIYSILEKKSIKLLLLLVWHHTSFVCKRHLKYKRIQLTHTNKRKTIINHQSCAKTFFFSVSKSDIVNHAVCIKLFFQLSFGLSVKIQQFTIYFILFIVSVLFRLVENIYLIWGILVRLRVFPSTKNLVSYSLCKQNSAYGN